MKELVVVGGGARNELWTQIVADATGVPVQVPEEADTAAVGAAMQAAALVEGAEVTEYAWEKRGRGERREVEPNAGSREAYADVASRFRDVGRRLFGGV